MKILSLSVQPASRSDALAIDDEQPSNCDSIVILGAELLPALDREMNQLATGELHEMMQTSVRVAA
jgi:hypothetical protein